MVWRALSPKGNKEKPWAIITFAEPKMINRIRMSTNREYYYETDYLTTKLKLQFSAYNVQILKADGSWRTVSDTHRISQLDKENDRRRVVREKLNSLIAEHSDKSPKPSFIGRFIKPKTSNAKRNDR